VRELLEQHRIPVVATATGGTRGRTVRVEIGTSKIVVREAGGKDTELLAASRALEMAA